MEAGNLWKRDGSSTLLTDYQGAAPPASKLMKFRIAVHTKKASEYEQLVMDMSTPDHPSYGNDMSGREVNDYLRPSRDVSDAVFSWLESEKVPEDSIEDDRDFIVFNVPIAQAERILDTHFYYFQHVETHITRIRTLQYSIPLSHDPTNHSLWNFSSSTPYCL